MSVYYAGAANRTLYRGDALSELTVAFALVERSALTYPLIFLAIGLALSESLTRGGVLHL